jgi:hypothetical protein
MLRKSSASNKTFLKTLQMNRGTKHFTFLLAFLLISTLSFAQNVFIANDFGACGVGLRDSSGHWIVQPTYQEIHKMGDGNFKVLSGSKEGVIASTGKIVIPPVYDYISYEATYIDSIVHIFYIVENDGLEGLLNEQNQIIVPLVCRTIEVGADGTIIAEKTKKRYSIYTFDGRESVIPKKQGTPPMLMGDHLLLVSRNSFGITFIERYKYNKRHPRKSRRHLRITLRKKFGVMNDSFRLIVPKKYNSINYGPAKYSLITVVKRNRTGYYSNTGKEIWAPVYKEVDFYSRRYYRYHPTEGTQMNKTGFTTAKYKGKYGILGANGDTILPFIYSYISAPYGYFGSNWFTTKDGLDGIYNPYKKQWVLLPEYESLQQITSYRLPMDTASVKSNSHFLYNENYDGLTFLLAYKNGKYGIISSTGQELLPIIYDDYIPGFDGYCFRKDTSYFMVTVPGYSYGDARHSRSSTNVVTVAPTDHTFKKITRKNGTILYINPELLTDSAQLSLYNLQSKEYCINPETYDRQLHATALIITPLYPSNYLKGIGKTYSFHTTHLSYEVDNATDDFIIEPGMFRLRSLSVLAEDTFHTYYLVGYNRGVYREDGSVLAKPFSFSTIGARGTSNGLTYFYIDCGKNKSGLIDGNGKLLIDTVWNEIGKLSGKYVWVKKYQRYFLNPRYSYSWNILDTTTNELLLSRKKCSGAVNNIGSAAVIIDRKEGDKLFNLETKKYILDGNVRNLISLDSAGNYFAVRTCYGHIGIIDGNGKWVADTSWDRLLNANNIKQGEENRPFYYEGSYPIKSDLQYCVLANDTGWLIFDGDKGIVTHDKKTAAYLLNMAGNSSWIDTAYGIVKKCFDCPSYSYADTTRKNEKLNAWQEKMLFDSLFCERFVPDTNYFWHDYTCPDCRKRNPHQYFEYRWAGNYDRESLHHEIEFSNDSCFSVARKNLNSYYSNQQDPSDLFFTVMLFKDGIHPMLLDSLFTGSEWKNFITEQTTIYFESHPGIEGNCHNPYMLPMVMKDRFIITPNGIELYPPNYKEKGNQLFVPISWQQLKPYLRKDIASKIGVH